MRLVPEGTMAYGMQLPIQAQSTLFVAEWEKRAGPDELVAIAQKADELGLLYVAVCDHVAIPERLAPAMGTAWYDTIATLGMLAGVTTRVRLLSHVWVLAYRHPFQSAKSFMTLDHLSKGRVVVGVGAGHVPEEFALLGRDFERRGALLDEALASFTRAMTDEFVDGFGLSPRPVQSPRPPIWVGGSSRPALRRAAAHGDGWLPQGTPRAQMPEQLAYLRAQREKVRNGEPMDVGAICEFLYVGEPSWDVGRGTVAGKPDLIAASLAEFKRMGVDHLQVRFKARSLGELLDQMDAFAAEVVPLVDEA